MKSSGKGEIRHTYLSNAQGSCLLNSLSKSCLHQRKKESFLFIFEDYFNKVDIDNGTDSYNCYDNWKTNCYKRLAMTFAYH